MVDSKNLNYILECEHIPALLWKRIFLYRSHNSKTMNAIDKKLIPLVRQSGPVLGGASRATARGATPWGGAQSILAPNQK